MPKTCSQAAKGIKKDSKMTPSTSKTLETTSACLDLNTFEEVDLVKRTEFTPVETTAQALERLGGSAERFLSIINEGLESETRRAMKSDSNIPWMAVAEDGTVAPFQGVPAEKSVVNPLVLNLAKSIFGYDKDKPLETRQEAKKQAIALIKSNDVMKEGLKAQAAAAQSK